MGGEIDGPVKINSPPSPFNIITVNLSDRRKKDESLVMDWKHAWLEWILGRRWCVSRESFLDRRVQTARREDEEASLVVPKSRPNFFSKEC